MKCRALALIVMIGLSGAPFGCDSDRVGDPCIPEDEYAHGFSGFDVDEVNTESRSFQCPTRLCLVHHFQGRVSCPYGQTEEEASGNPRCFVPDSTTPVAVAVPPQREARRPEDAVYCSCRCDGPDPNARYCECPSGFECTELVPDVSVTRKELVGSYCVREGTARRSGPAAPVAECERASGNCD